MTIQMVVYTEIIYAMTVVLLEIPTGIIADKWGNSLSASGTLWISEDPKIGPAMIRQCLTVNSDIVFFDQNNNPTHYLSEDIIEDDVMDVNSTVIEAPSESETDDWT